MHRLALAVLVAFLTGCGPKLSQPDPLKRSIANAARFLWSQQAADGGWQSRTYGLLRSGQSLTPFVLLALLDVPEDMEPANPKGLNRAVTFILEHINDEGAVGRADPTIEDYPNYATALALRALIRAGKLETINRMVACLRQQQLADHPGWETHDSGYGAWGIGGPLRRPPHTGHIDLSMTRHVLQSLSSAGTSPEDPVFSKAETFLGRCQNPDGGFIFSTVIVDANKAGYDGKNYRSYGTTTADGVLSLLALGLPVSDPRLEAGVKWLTAHHRTDRVPGFSQNTQQWADGMIYYYHAASAQVFRRLGIREAPPGRDWRKDLVEELLRWQRSDGSWLNSNFLMKEDDPLIATTFALIALLATL